MAEWIVEITDGLPHLTNMQPLVRCRDCKHYVVAHLKSDYTEDMRFRPSVCIKGEFAKPRKPDWFCADGERKEKTDE